MNSQLTMTTQDLRTALDAGQRLQLIDVRSAQEYAEGHLPCALNIPLEEVEKRQGDLIAEGTVVLVCRSGRRAEMAREALAAQHPNLVVLTGGTEAWEQAGQPTVATTRARLPLMRQVQLVVGPLILLGVTMALTVDPRWALLAGFIGAGLTMAGATGWCGMALLLAKMPFNQSKPAACPSQEQTA